MIFAILPAVIPFAYKEIMTTILDSRRADFDLFTPLLGRIPWDTALERRRFQRSWLIFKDLLQAQELIHANEQEINKAVGYLHR